MLYYVDLPRKMFFLSVYLVQMKFLTSQDAVFDEK